MKVSAKLLFRGRTAKLVFPAVPRIGDSVRLDELGDRDLRVRAVVWTRSGLLLELADPLKGHEWVEDSKGSSGWHCSRCGCMIIAHFSRSHPDFPGNDVEECYFEIAAYVHSQ